MWLTIAMILSLGIAAMIFVPMVAMVGISPMGADLLGGEGTITHVANATLWNAYASFGLSMIIPIVVGAGCLILGLVLILRKVEPKMEVKG